MEGSEMDLTSVYHYMDWIGTWGDRTFPNQTRASLAKHLAREAAEVLADVDDDEKFAQELADCFILVMGLAFRNNVDLERRVREKMAINMKRKWGQPDAEGVIEHVRDEGVT